MSNTPSDAEIEKLAAEHLKAFAQFTGAGDVWVEGEVAFARAVLAKWGSPQPVAREQLTDAQIAEMMRDTCVCGEPQAPGTVHRVDGPCYVAAPQPSPSPAPAQPPKEHP